MRATRSSRTLAAAIPFCEAIVGNVKRTPTGQKRSGGRGEFCVPTGHLLETDSK